MADSRFQFTAGLITQGPGIDSTHMSGYDGSFYTQWERERASSHVNAHKTRIVSQPGYRTEPFWQTVSKRDETVHLAPEGFELLSYLMARADLSVTHESLLHAV
jgi:hypothetical protein